MNHVGVDVDSQSLVCKIQRNGKDFPISIFANTPIGHRQFIKWATKYHKPARVCMEATGVYSLQFALALHQTQSIEVAVMNPKAIKHFATAYLQRGKTDALDAESILQYLLRMPFKEWQPPEEEYFEIQQISRRIVHLNTMLTRERNRHHAADRMGSMGRIVANDAAVTMRHYERRIKVMESELIKLMESIPELSERLELIKSATGIADKAGPRILAELSMLPEDMSGPQWVAFAGLDPRPYESGTSTNKPRRITKAGNRYLREALYFPALVAIKLDPNVKAFYEKLVAKGKKPMQAIVAVMRKMLLAIWGMFKHKTPWNGEKFYVLNS